MGKEDLKLGWQGVTNDIGGWPDLMPPVPPNAPRATTERCPERNPLPGGHLCTKPLGHGGEHESSDSTTWAEPAVKAEPAMLTALDVVQQVRAFSVPTAVNVVTDEYEGPYIQTPDSVAAVLVERYARERDKLTREALGRDYEAVHDKLRAVIAKLRAERDNAERRLRELTEAARRAPRYSCGVEIAGELHAVLDRQAREHHGGNDG